MTDVNQSIPETGISQYYPLIAFIVFLGLAMIFLWGAGRNPVDPHAGSTELYYSTLANQERLNAINAPNIVLKNEHHEAADRYERMAAEAR